MLSGVPQGSVIGLFLFFDGIADCVFQNVDINLFADDSKVFSQTPDDLQLAINNMNEWLCERQLLLAPQKCAILKIKKPKIIENSTYYIDKHPVQQDTSVKDLGVFIAHDLKWSCHVDFICHKASNISYQLRTTVKSKNIWTWINLYVTYIRPKLEYCTPIWSPYLQKDIDKVENIQRRFTKFAFYKCSIPFSSYEDRLYKVNLLTLKQRRLFFDLVLVYKIVKNMSDILFEDYFLFIESPYNLRSHNLQIKSKQHFKSLQCQNSFFERVTGKWNALPQDLISSVSLDVFKQKLSMFLKQPS